MYIILYPVGGLANRMRAIDSAVNLCAINDKLNVWWVKDSGLNCDFQEIFAPVDFIKEKVLKKVERKYFKLYNQKNKYIVRLLFILEKLKIFLFLDEVTCLDHNKLVKVHQYLFCLIRTWEAFYPSGIFNKELFVFRDSQLLDKELSKINIYTIGVHIRRTDNIWSIENSPIELFEISMIEEIKKEPETNFYLCSDDEKTKTYFQNRFKGKVNIPDGILDRDSKEGINQAACEMFVLSKTNKILGSYWSSFGEIAARLGNIEIEICTTSQL